MTNHPISPHLLGLLGKFLYPLSRARKRKRLDVFEYALKKRDHVIVFLENFVAQIVKEFGIEEQSMRRVYPLLVRQIKRDEWKSSNPVQLQKLGLAICEILHEWDDIDGSGYVSSPRAYRTLLKTHIPKLLGLTLEYAEMLQHEDLSKNTRNVLARWRGIFNVRH